MHNEDLIGTGPAGDESPDEFSSNDQSDVAADPPEVVVAHPEAESGSLEGDMGISSERRGDETASDSVESTGSVGSATTQTDGTNPTEGGTATSADAGEESNTAEVPSHESDPARNPGHSHG